MRHDGLPALILLSILGGLATGCSSLGGNGDGDSAKSAGGGRTTGAFIEDQAIEMKAARQLKKDAAVAEQTHINVTSYNTIVLVTGETPTQPLHDRVIQIVRNVEKVSKVYDEITIAAPSALTARTSDSLLTAKVKAKLFGSKELDATRVKVVTEKGVVYLMGLITRKQADVAADIARHVSGVQRVVKLFEYTN
jgi:osmotically-inducible protein OsmY